MNWHWLRTFARAYLGRAKAGLLFAVSAWLPVGGGCSAISADGFASGSASWDAGTADGSLIGSPTDASSCHPGSVQTFNPNTYHEAMSIPAACDADQTRGYFDACFGPQATSPICSAFAANNPNCAACIRSSDSAARYGPLIGAGPLVRTNVAGCIELTEPSLLSCAKWVQSLSGCEYAACAVNCQVGSDSASLSAYGACAAAADADMNECKIYTDKATCLNVAASADLPYGKCLESFATFYNYAVPLFCGPNASPVPSDDAGAADGGASAEDGGAEDAAGLDGGVGDVLDAAVDGASFDAGGPSRDAGASDARASDAAAPDGARAGDAGFSDATSAGVPADGAEGDAGEHEQDGATAD